MNTPHLNAPRLSVFAVVLRALHLLALALWLGGLVAIGALVAPTVFRAVRAFPALAGSVPLQNTLAGSVVGGSLQKFGFLSLACAAVLLVVNSLLLSRTSRRWTTACLGATLLLLASSLFLLFGLTPAMDQAQASGNLVSFDKMHHLYEQLSTLFQMPLLLLLLLFTALRDTSRS